jgi:DNA-binding MarR family transcriptional regulator
MYFMRPTDLADCADCLCLASRRAARMLTRAYDRELRPFDIRATQFTILVMLLLRGPSTIGDLAEALGIERTTLSRNLALLETRGWIELRPGDDDARARVATVTRHGRRRVEAALPGWRAAQAKAKARIGAAAVDAMQSLSRQNSS